MTHATPDAIERTRSKCAIYGGSRNRVDILTAKSVALSFRVSYIYATFRDLQSKLSSKAFATCKIFFSCQRPPTICKPTGSNTDSSPAAADHPIGRDNAGCPVTLKMAVLLVNPILGSKDFNTDSLVPFFGATNGVVGIMMTSYFSNSASYASRICLPMFIVFAYKPGNCFCKYSPLMTVFLVEGNSFSKLFAVHGRRACSNSVRYSPLRPLA